MKEQLKDENNRKYLVFLTIIFIAIFIMYRNLPVAKDALISKFFYEDCNGLFGVIFVAFRRYFTVNGRILSTIVCAFFEQNDLLNDIASTLIFILIFHIIAKNIDRTKRLYALFFSVTLFMGISSDARMEVYFYAVLFYMIAVLIVLWISKNIDLLFSNKCIYKKELFYIALSTILACTWIENVAVGVFVSMFLMGIIYFVKNKKIVYTHWLMIGIAFLSMCFLLISTVIVGSRQTSVLNDRLDLVILENLNAIFQKLLTEQNVLFTGLSVIAAVVVWKNAKYKIIKNIYSFIMASIAIINILVFLAFRFTSYEFSIKFSNIFFYTNPTSFLIVIKCILIVVLYFIPICYAKKFNQLFFLYFAGMSSLIPSILTQGNIAARITSFSVFMLIICYVILSCEALESIIVQKSIFVLKIVLILMFTIGIDDYIYTINGISEKQAIRDERIAIVREAQILGQWDYEQELVLPKHKEKIFNGPNPGNLYYIPFLRYYGLDERTVYVYE